MSGIADYVSLAKPRITALVAFTTASGLWLAPIRPRLSVVLVTLLGTVLAVASANVLNMYLERDTDALMSRTMHRPLPARRIDPLLALRFGLLLGAVSLPLLSLAVGPRPGLLAAIALVSYVLLYTPMKRRSTAALLVGAVAGAMPPLFGWTAATGTFDLPGGERKARRNIVCYTLALVSVSLLFVPLGVARNLYFVTALLAGTLFVAYGLIGLRPASGRRWARKEFALSLAYLTVLFGALVIDHAGVVRWS